MNRIVLVFFFFSTIAAAGEPAIAPIVKRLSDNDEAVRHAAVKQLRAAGPAARPALPALGVLLKDEKFTVEVLEVIGRIGTPDSVPPLREALKDRRREIRLAALHAIKYLAREGREASPSLIALFAEPSDKMRINAVATLGAVLTGCDGPDADAAVAALVTLLNQHEAVMRTPVCDALGLIGPRAVPALISMLNSPVPDTRAAACGALAKMGPAALPALAGLIKQLQDGNSEGKRDAAIAVGNIAAIPLVKDALPPPLLKEAIAPLRELLKHNSVETSRAAIVALGKIGADSLPALVEGLKSQTQRPELRYACAEALTRVGAPAYPALSEALNDTNPEVRAMALEAWCRLTVPPSGKLSDAEKEKAAQTAEATAKLLAPFLKDEHMPVRRAAAGALSNIGAPAACVAPALMEALHDPQDSVRQRAAEAISQLPPDPARAPALVAALEKNGAETRVGLTRAISKLGPVARIAAPFLITSIKNDEGPIRHYSAEALGNVLATPANVTLASGLPVPAAPENPHLKEAVATLGAALSETEPQMVAQAADALAKIGAPSVAVLPALIEALKSKRIETRMRVLEAISSAGPLAKDAIPGLIISSKDDLSAETRDKSIDVLVKIGSAAVPAMLEILKDGRSNSRRLAADALLKFSTEAHGGIPIFIATLKDPEDALRLKASEILSIIGADAVPALIPCLKDPSSQVRGAAAATLNKIGAPAKDAAKALVEALKDENAKVSQNAAEALGKIGLPALPLLIASMQDPNREARLAAMRALGKLGPDAKDAIPLLLKALSDERNEIITAASTSLTQIGKPAIAPLADLLKEENPVMRYNAASIIINMGPAAKDAVPVLAGLLKDDVKRVRILVLTGLTQLGPLALDASPALIERFQNADPQERELSLAALNAIGPDCAPVLITALGIENSSVRREVAKLLGKYANAPNPTDKQKEETHTWITALEKACKDPSAHARQGAALALGYIGAPAKNSLPVIKELLTDKSAEVKLSATWTMGQLDPAARDLAVPALIEALKQEKLETRIAAAEGLEHIGPPAKPAISVMLDSISTENLELEAIISRGLGKIGSEAVPELIVALLHPKLEHRRTAATALGLITPVPAAAIAPLCITLKDQEVSVKCRAAASLKIFGPAATEAIPALIAALNEEEPAVRKSAIEALSIIGPGSTDVATALLAIQKDVNDEVRLAAHEQFKKMGALINPAILNAMKDDRADVRKAAVTMVSKMNAASMTAILPGVVELLKHEQWETREAAASALGWLRTTASKDAAPMLKDALADKVPDVRFAAARTLAYIQGTGTIPEIKELLPILNDALRDERPRNRAAAAAAIRRLTTTARDAVPNLLEALKDEDSTVRTEARATLESIGASNADMKQRITIMMSESSATEACNQYFDAQDTYYQTDWDGDGVLEYAQELDGNFGLFDIHAKKRRQIAGIFADVTKKGGKEMYRFKILKAQGEKSPGGPKPYVVNGNMVGGHAMVAYPVEYNASGRKTFLINDNGGMYEKDMGAETFSTVEKMTDFNPDETWEITRKPLPSKKNSEKGKELENFDF